MRAIADRLHVLPITPGVALDAVGIELPQRDPFDRIIAATARAHELTLITKDRNIRAARVVKTLL